ncbi:uncharacterized protein LOC124158599 isoform X2 [Ischnura elegans]|uniref:uncharacterized protein LOC124158599 isoform X2 n=1 Tax=Ischnura elegans TaxID=197161 RepID=UPI001ED8BF73|nr:uncharacterized protein LOC124158599 isoform X2 [Ischnura elegans]
MSGGGGGPAGPRRPLLALLLATATLLMTLTRGAGSAGSIVPGSPENVTVVFLNATSVKVTWDTTLGHAEKYDVVYKPTDASLPGHECYRVVAVVAGNTGAVTLEGLQADRQYQVTVAAVRAGRKFRSRPVVFRTLAAPPPPSVGQPPPPPPYPRSNQQGYGAGGRMVAATGGTFQVRGIEVCIVLLVLAVWAGAIALFFNRWGKIRMLLPYQPDYKEQMKAAAAAAAAGPVPGAVPGGQLPPGALGTPGGQPSSISCPQAAGQSCSQHLHWSRLASSARFDYAPPPGARFSRPRINSVFAAYGASSLAGGATGGGSSWGGLSYGHGGGMGPRSHYGGSRYGGVGATSSGGGYGGLYFAASTEFPACRKARSAENIPMGPLVVLPTPPGDGEEKLPDYDEERKKDEEEKKWDRAPPGEEEIESGAAAKEQ